MTHAGPFVDSKAKPDVGEKVIVFQHHRARRQ